MSKVIFRKIGGRIIPIKIANKVDAITTASTWSRHRKVTASLKSGEVVGTLNLKIRDKGKSAEVINIHVAKEFRKHGIAKQLFKKTADFLDRAGFKFLRTQDIQSPAMVKIRSKYKSKFWGFGFGKYQDQTKIISKDQAIKIVKENKTPKASGVQVSATTFIKKTKNKR